MIEESCDYCHDKGVLGRDIRAFRFATPSGKEVIRYLHPTGGERRCFHLYEERYKAHMAARQSAKAAGNG